MPSGAPRQWQLEGFLPLFDAWVAHEGLEEYGDLPLIVLSWIHSRSRTPYLGVKRDPEIENLWVGKVPGSADNLGRAVLCSYFIYETTSTVRCATLGWLTGPYN